MSYPTSSVALPGLWSEKHPSGGTKRKALGWDPDSGTRPVGATDSQVGREWGAGGSQGWRLVVGGFREGGLSAGASQFEVDGVESV